MESFPPLRWKHESRRPIRRSRRSRQDTPGKSAFGLGVPGGDTVAPVRRLYGPRRNAAWDVMFERVAMLADLPPGTMRRVTVRGHDVLIANAGGAVFATDDTCTHEEASLSNGVLSGEIVRCPLHGATFCLRDGAPLDEPAEEPLRCHEVRVEDGAVSIRLDGG